MPRLWLTKILAGIQSSAELVDLSDAGVAPPNYKKGSILWRWREEWKQSIIRTVVKSDVTLFHWTDWGSHHHYGLTKPAMSCLSKTGPVSCGCLVIWMLVLDLSSSSAAVRLSPACDSYSLLHTRLLPPSSLSWPTLPLTITDGSLQQYFLQWGQLYLDNYSLCWQMRLRPRLVWL